MLDNNQIITDQILILPLSQIAAVIGEKENKENVYDFLDWIYETLDQSETDYSAGIETTDDLIDLLIALAEHYEPNPAPNRYQERLESRRAYYEEMAAKRQAESDSTWATARKMQDLIPPGQPILVGHHSEKWDRRYRDRIWATMGKAVKLADTAKYHARRAQRVGRGGISGDDPNAVIKLRRKLAQRQELQRQMKAANKIVKSRRKNYSRDEKIADLQKAGFSHETAVKIATPDSFGYIGFPRFQLSNNNAEIRRIQQRIQQVIANNQAAEKTPDREYRLPNGDILTVEFNQDDNRIRLHFPGKPDEETRTIIKRYAFRWSPRNVAWQRKITANARAATTCLLHELKAEEIE